MPKKRAYVDELGKFDPSAGEETPDERRSRLRASYGLPEPEEPEKEDYEPSAVTVAVASDAIGPAKLGEVLRHPTKTSTEFFDNVDVAQEVDTLEELRKRLYGKIDDGPEAERFWEVAAEAMAQIRNEHARVEEKRKKSEAINAAAAVHEGSGAPAPLSTEAVTQELSDIQGGKRGSPTSPANSKRRAELRRQLREALTRG